MVQWLSPFQIKKKKEGKNFSEFSAWLLLNSTYVLNEPLSTRKNFFLLSFSLSGMATITAPSQKLTAEQVHFVSGPIRQGRTTCLLWRFWKGLCGRSLCSFTGQPRRADVSAPHGQERDQSSQACDHPSPGALRSSPGQALVRLCLGSLIMTTSSTPKSYNDIVIKMPQTKEQRIEVISQFQSGKSLNSFSKSTKISRTTIYWPPNSPDLNIVENLWSILKTNVGKRHPKNVEALERVVLEEFHLIPSSYVEKFIKSIKTRLNLTIINSGGFNLKLHLEKANDETLRRSKRSCRNDDDGAAIDERYIFERTWHHPDLVGVSYSNFIRWSRIRDHLSKPYCLCWGFWKVR